MRPPIFDWFPLVPTGSRNHRDVLFGGGGHGWPLGREAAGATTAGHPHQHFCRLVPEWREPVASNKCKGQAGTSREPVGNQSTPRPAVTHCGPRTRK
jgi:hypothetical protein